MMIKNLIVEPVRDGERARRFWYAIWEAATKAAESGKPLTPEQLHRADIENLFPRTSDIPVTLVKYKSVYGNVSTVEMVTMCQIIRLMKPKLLFEIGTFDGGSTIQFAHNSEDESIVYTLDLPPAHPLKSDRGIVDHTTDAPGFRFKDSGAGSKIRQLFGDSRTFDFSPYQGTIDFVFVDGSHRFEYVMADSRNAFSMLAPGGVILWHDYSDVWPDVRRALAVFAKDRPIYSINGTGLALYMDGLRPSERPAGAPGPASQGLAGLQPRHIAR